MSNQQTPRNYFEADRVGAFRYGRPPSDWTNNEIVQIDLPSGYRCHIVTELSNYKFNRDVFTAETTYLGRTVRFTQVTSAPGGEPLEDWKPINARGERIRLVVPAIEWKLLKQRHGRHWLVLKGVGILRSSIGFSMNGKGVDSNKDNYTKPSELRSLLIDYYQKKYSIPWIHDGRALMHAIADEHERIVRMQQADLSW